MTHGPEVTQALRRIWEPPTLSLVGPPPGPAPALAAMGPLPVLALGHQLSTRYAGSAPGRWVGGWDRQAHPEDPRHDQTSPGTLL
jgi:hypothetical protein